jgi:hypothetical protein
MNGGYKFVFLKRGNEVEKKFPSKSLIPAIEKGELISSDQISIDGKHWISLGKHSQLEEYFLLPANDIGTGSKVKDTKQQDDTKQIAYEKIGGWLILLGIAIAVTPFQMVLGIIENLPAYEPETWSAITSPGTDAYHPYWKATLIYEMVGNIIFLIFSLLVAIAFIRRRKFFPKWMIVFLLAHTIFLTIDYFTLDLIPALANQTEMVVEMRNGVLQQVLGCVIWTAYLLVSKRVKGTFTT